MDWIYQIVLAVLRGVLPWMFSGEEKTTVERVVGLEDLDESTLAGVKDRLPPMCVILGLLLLSSGCALGGAKVEYQLVMCEPGGYGEVATDEKIPVIVTKDVSTKVPVKKNMAGNAILPMSVYRRMRAEWIKNHPEE